MTRPDGIAKMARLLVHRDVSVRRRAAEAFSTLFERLGSGEHAQPAAADRSRAASAGPRGARAARGVRDDRARSAGALPCRAGAHARATGGATMRCAPTPRRRPPAARSAAWRRRIPDRRAAGYTRPMTGRSRAHGRRRHDGRAGGPTVGASAQVPANRPRITGIDHIVFRASDAAAARRFYGEVLGLLGTSAARWPAASPATCGEGQPTRQVIPARLVFDVGQRQTDLRRARPAGWGRRTAAAAGVLDAGSRGAGRAPDGEGCRRDTRTRHGGGRDWGHRPGRASAGVRPA